MLGSKDPKDWRRTAYLRYIFEQKGNWQGTGLAMTDSGLKLAAQDLNAIGPYQGGFFGLYPQFVAQYLDVDRFYEKVKNVTMSTPSLYETTSSLEGSPIEPIATRAWRIRVQLPRDATPMPYTVRFVLESPDQVSLNGLHLIVDSKVIDRPHDPLVPYSHTRRTDQDTPNNQGELEYFVRVANVAPDAVATKPPEFVLRAEVEGFYGEKEAKDLLAKSPIKGGQQPGGVNQRAPDTANKAPGASSKKTTEPSINALVGDLPPGFEITGPGKYWTCSGGDDARASFAIFTPDGLADQLEWALPQALKNIENDLNNAELQAHNKGQSAELKHVQQQRKTFEDNMQSELHDSGVRGEIARAADESRRKK